MRDCEGYVPQRQLYQIPWIINDTPNASEYPKEGAAGTSDTTWGIKWVHQIPQAMSQYITMYLNPSVIGGHDGLICPKEAISPCGYLYQPVKY